MRQDIRSQPTYEELKLSFFRHLIAASVSSQPTYEELKRLYPLSGVALMIAFSAYL